MPLATSIPDCARRPWSRADKASLVANANNRKVWLNLTESFPHPYTERDAEEWFEVAACSGPSVPLAITLGRHAIGGIGAIGGNGVCVRTAHFGHWLGEPYWGKGIATAAALALLQHLGSETSFARLEARVFAWNPASMRVLEKVGFRREGLLRASVSKDGQLIDSVMYAYIIGA